MIKRKSGKIINFASGVARIGIPGHSLYCAAKSGVIGMTMSLAAEVGPLGINVNGICPGMGATAIHVPLGTPPEEFQAFVSSIAPVRRLTTPQDIGNAVVFLASDAASDITGQTIQVDGGAFRM